MDKKIECKIVQDLLLGYVDDVLNEESKNVVEKHLSECEICQKRLKEIRADIEENEVSQEKEIDYLRKIRIKNRVKSILIAIGILIFICLIIYLRKFLIVNDFTDKAKSSLESQNFYKETIQHISNEEVALIKEYYKDGKYKKITENYTDEGMTVGNAEYATVDTDEKVEINNEKRTVTIIKGKFTKLINSENNLKHVPFMESFGFISKAGKAFYYSIHTSYRDLGREYYVLKNQFNKDYKWEAWIDKDTGLPLKIIDSESRKTYFQGTNILKEARDSISEYRYEFDVVTDEDVTVPDYTGYEIRHINQEIVNNQIINK